MNVTTYIFTGKTCFHILVTFHEDNDCGIGETYLNSKGLQGLNHFAHTRTC